MNQTFLSFMSLVRLLAAGIAVIYHVRFLLFASYAEVHVKGPALKLFYFITSLGHEAFVVYMVISGLILGGLSHRRWRRGIDPRRDLLRRSAWFYCLLVPALLLGGGFDFVGSLLLACSGVYGYFAQFSPDFNWEAFAGNLLMLQRFVVPGLGSNTMLYLLSYECWAYLSLAAFFVFGQRDRKLGWHAAAALAVVASGLAPEFFGYLVLWWMGLYVFRLGNNTRVRIARHIGVLAFVAALAVSRWGGAHLPDIPHALVPAARMALDLMFGAGFCLLITSWLQSGVRSSRPARWTTFVWRLNRRFEGASVTLFATHFPFMMFLVAAASARFHVPIGGQPSLPAFVLFGATVVGIYCYAYMFATLASGLARMLRSARFQLAEAS